VCPEIITHVLKFVLTHENSESDQFCDTVCSEWLLYATDAALDSTVDQFCNNICAY